MIKLGVIVTHPIQYQVPLYQLLTTRAKVEPHVIFTTDYAVRSFYDPGFNTSIKFDMPLLDGYNYTFAKNYSPKPSPSTFIGSINPGLIKLINKSKFDCLLIHGWASMSNWIVFTLSKLTNIPYMLRGETRPDIRYPYNTKTKLKHALIEPVLKYSAACLAIGSENRQFYMNYKVPMNKIYDAPYSVNTNKFEEQGIKGRQNKTEMLLSIGLDPNLPTILYAAKFQERKRPLDLIYAVDKLAIKVNLVMIGDGILLDTAKKLARTRPWLKLLGFVNHSKIGYWYGLCDFIVLPSSNEPWGLVINEAMSAGAIPIVSDSVGCGKDLVSPEIGWIFKTCDINNLARILFTACGDNLLNTRSQKAIARSREFGLEATAQGIEKAAYSILGSSGIDVGQI